MRIFKISYSLLLDNVGEIALYLQKFEQFFTISFDRNCEIETQILKYHLP